MNDKSQSSLVAYKRDSRTDAWVLDQPTRDSEEYEATFNIDEATFLDVRSYDLRSGTCSIGSNVT